MMTFHIAGRWPSRVMALAACCSQGPLPRPRREGPLGDTTTRPRSSKSPGHGANKTHLLSKRKASQRRAQFECFECILSALCFLSSQLAMCFKARRKAKRVSNTPRLRRPRPQRLPNCSSLRQKRSFSSCI